MQDIKEVISPVVETSFADLQNAKVGDAVADGVVTDVQTSTDADGKPVTHTTVTRELTEAEKEELEDNLAATEDFIHFIFDNERTAGLFVTKLFANERFVDGLFGCKYFQHRMAQFSVDIFTRTLHQMEMAAQNRLNFEFVAGPVATGNEGELTVNFVRDDKGAVEITEVTLGGRDVKSTINPQVQAAIIKSTINLALEYSDISAVYGTIVTSELPEVAEAKLNEMLDVESDQIQFEEAETNV